MITQFLYLILFLHPGVMKPVSGELDKSVINQYSLYVTMNLAEKGLSNEVFRLALKGYYKLKIQGKLRNPDILTIADFSQSSKNKRLYVIDLSQKVILFNTYVTHGRNTGEEYAEHFSNVPGSNESSLGFYITKGEQVGHSVGVSLVLDGMEKGFNDNAMKRGIIMHGGDYATEYVVRKIGRLGKSYGCPVLPPDEIQPVVETIKDGTCLFIYQYDYLYLTNSPLLN
jgi:hypothetical protein